jgi:microcin C transport system ATP-binding protein
MSDEIVVLRRGRVVEHGPAARIFAAPVEPYTRALLAAALDLEAMEPEAAG